MLLPTHESRRTASQPTGGALVNVLVLAALTTGVLAAWVLVWLDGWDYYLTPLRIRGYHPAHAVLKPSGSVAHALGACGLLMMFVPVIYSVRKKWKRLRTLGSLKTWLEVHIYCGIVGPVLVTIHAAGKFNGLISVAYWSMVLVVASGFVGRYLFVRIPKSIRGTEMGFEEITARAVDLKDRLTESGLPARLLGELEAFEHAVVPDPAFLSVRGFVFEHARIRRGLRRLGRDMFAAGVDRELARSVLALEDERAWLLARLAYLRKTKQLFGAWHVLHQPLVYLMFAIAALHVGLAVYLGYVPFSRGR